MSALEHMRTLARGDRPRDDGMLEVTRCAWGGSEAIGEEAILAAFCARPLSLTGALEIETPEAAALIGENDALIADLYASRIGRLWRVAPGLASPEELGVDVAFDPDMHQLRGGLYFRREDHRDLDADSAERIQAAARAYLDNIRRDGKLRVRGYVVRAFASPAGAAALLAVHALGNEVRRSAGFSYAVISVEPGSDAVRTVGAAAPVREWTPRI